VISALVLAATVSVGSKAFTEGVILGELVTEDLDAAGVPVVHRAQLGGTQVLWKALLAGDIDVYAEYTGTIAAEILAGKGPAARDEDGLRRALAAQGVVMGAPLGFADTYALGMKAERARALGVRRISDLAAHPDIKLGFSNEFMDRQDGWPALRDFYGLGSIRDVRGLDHDLAYRAVASGAIDVTDFYSTDAEIKFYGLTVLEDDRHHFPPYHAVLLWRADLPRRAPTAVGALEALAGRIGDADMIDMNARAKLDGVPEARVAADFLRARLSVQAKARVAGFLGRLARNTRDHLFLVAVSLFAAILVALPLGILSARHPRLGQAVLGVVGLIQTIPSLALLVFMIPLFGIGALPAMIALFLYSLLPIVRNTHAGLTDVPATTREAAAAMGLPSGARLRLVELPMASRAILAGIKTSAVINVGTATLGAVIGAGGYGQPILSGIRLAKLGLTLEGAVPAAVLALLVQAGFELLERLVVPRGLRLPVTGE
jgi:osmoprotectant transport system substrate-binding protein/osmoprotectant transport system permease protein